MKKLLFISVIVLSCFNSSAVNKLSDPFDHITTAQRFWLKKPDMLSSKALSDESTKNFLKLAPIAIDAILSRENSPWQIYKITNYDDETGYEKLINYGDLVVGQDGHTKQIVQGGYYFISKGDPATSPHLIVQPATTYYYSYTEAAWFDYTYANITFEDADAGVAEEFIAEFRNYVNGADNPYKAKVLEFGGDYGDLYSTGFQLRFLLNVSDLKASWDNLIMDSALKNMVYQNTEGFLRSVEEFKQFGLQPKKGVLFEGPPGTGKSLVAQVLMSSIMSGELKDQVTFIIVTARHLKYKTAIQTLFQEAQRLAPAVIFIEDIDLLGVKKRDENGYDQTGREEILNEFLNGIDGVSDNKGLLVVATTNKVQNVDSALLRSERLGIHFYFGLPTFQDRAQFFEIFGRKHALWEAGITAQSLSAKTEGLSGADIIEIIGLAKQAAMVDGSWADTGHENLLLTQVYFDSAIAKVRENHGDSGHSLNLQKTMQHWEQFFSQRALN